MPPGAFLVTPPSRRGLVIPIFFFGGHLPQTSGFRSAKEILAVSFATQRRAFILSDRNIFYTPPGGGEQRRGLMPLGLFLFIIIFPLGKRADQKHFNNIQISLF